MTWFGAFAALGAPLMLLMIGWLAVVANERAGRKQVPNEGARAEPTTNQAGIPADPVPESDLEYAIAKAYAERATMLDKLGRLDEALWANSEAIAHFSRAEHFSQANPRNRPGRDTAPAEQIAGA